MIALIAALLIAPVALPALDPTPLATLRQDPRGGAPAAAPLSPGAPGAAAPALPAGQNPAGQPQKPGEVPPIQEEADSYVLNFAETPEEGMSLEEFIKACQEATARNFTFSKENTELLKSTKIRMFGTKRIPKSDFYAFFQIMMFINDFACIEVGPPHLSVIVIQSLGNASRNPASNTNILAKPIYVLPEDLPQYEDQPAVLVRTLLHLPNTDVRQLANSLRTIQGVNPNAEQIINAGQSNAVILTGFGSNIAALAKLLMLVDEASRVDEGVEPIFDVIKMEFAAAQDVADVIEQLLEARNKAAQDNRRAIPVSPDGGGGGLARNSSEAKILVDGRTNSLLVMAMPDDMPRIKDLVARLDVDVIEPERNYHIYTLENVKAEDLQKVLEDFLQDANKLADSGTGTGARAPGTGGTSGSNSNEIVVVADKETNSLLIAANKTRYQELLELVRHLDQRQPQVLIETALIELSGDFQRDIGVELGFADIPGMGSTGGFGVTSFGMSTFVDTDIPPDGIPDIKQPSLLTGITGGIIDGDDFALPVLVRLFQSRQNANVLNVPSVLVNNNGTATVTTKDEQPTTTITATGGGGVNGGQTQENFKDYQEAGITLTISPSISASRYLRLGVSLKVSNFNGTFSGAIPPPRITRELTTQVNVPDGDTMVIGGIITDNKTEGRQGVPWLSDIPLLGALFRRDTSSNNRTTLYFFVTPHILQDKDFADLAEISYKKKLAAVEVMGKPRMLIVDPNFGTSSDQPRLDGFDIPLYKSPAHGEVDAQSVGLDPVKQSSLIKAGKQEEEAVPPPADELPAPDIDPEGVKSQGSEPEQPENVPSKP